MGLPDIKAEIARQTMLTQMRATTVRCRKRAGYGAGRTILRTGFDAIGTAPSRQFGVWQFAKGWDVFAGIRDVDLAIYFGYAGDMYQLWNVLGLYEANDELVRRVNLVTDEESLQRSVSPVRNRCTAVAIIGDKADSNDPAWASHTETVARLLPHLTKLFDTTFVFRHNEIVMARRAAMGDNSHQVHATTVREQWRRHLLFGSSWQQMLNELEGSSIRAD